MTAVVSPLPEQADGCAGEPWWSGAEARAVAAIVLIVLAHASAFGYTLRQLSEGVDVTSPVAYVPFVPVVALAAAAQRWRRAPGESDRTAFRTAEGLVFVGCAGATLAVSTAFPSAFTTETLTWRADLAAVPLTAAAVIVAVFGLRMLWRLRTTIWFLSLMAPALYRPPIEAIRVATSWTTSNAVAVLGGVLPFVERTASSVGGRSVDVSHGNDTITLRVAEVCAGNGAVLAGLFAGASMWMLCTGERRAKWWWVALVAVLCWIGNLVRLVAVLAATSVAGVGAATGWFHDLAGAFGLLVALVLALALAPRFGIAPRARRVVPSESRVQRADVVSPRLGLMVIGALSVLVFAVSSLSVAATSRFDLMAGASRTPTDSLSSILQGWSVGSGPGQRTVIPGTDVAWAADYFGNGATWKTFYGRGPGDGAPIGIDVISTNEPTTFDTYGLAACFGFHGWRMDLNRTVALPGGRRAEQIVYTVRGAAAQQQAKTVGGVTRSVAIISWRQRSSSGRIERIALQQPQEIGNPQLDDLERFAAAIVQASDATVIP